MSVRVRPPAPTSKNASLRRSAGVFLMPAPCLHERGHKKKDRAAPSAQGVFASAERGRTLRVLHRREARTKEKERVRSTAAFASAERGRTLRVLHRHCAVRARAKIKDRMVLCQTGIIRTSLRAILFGAFAQPKLANMYTIACVAPVQHHPKISCSEVRAVPRQPIFG